MELGAKVFSLSTRVDDLLGRDRMSLGFIDLLLEIGNGIGWLSIQIECLLLNSLKRQLHRDRFTGE